MKYTTIPEAVTGLLASEKMELDQMSFVKDHIETDSSMHKEENGELTQLNALLGSLSTKDGKSGLALLTIDFRKTDDIKFPNEMDIVDMLTSFELPADFEFVPRTQFKEGDIVVHPDYGVCAFIDHIGGSVCEIITGLDNTYRRVQKADLTVYPGFEMGHIWKRRS